MPRNAYVSNSYGSTHRANKIFVKVDETTVKEVTAGWVARSDGSVQQFWPSEGGPQPGTFNYLATWAQSYADGHLNDSSHRGQLNYQGESSIHGDESSLWGFDYAQMQADLAGLTIDSVAIRLTSRWTYAGGGKTYHIMPHNHASAPSSLTLQDNMAKIYLGRGNTGSQNLPDWFGEGLRDGTQKGLGLRFTQPGEYAWGYCTGMYSTDRLVASPSDGDIIPCPTDELAMITIVASA